MERDEELRTVEPQLLLKRELAKVTDVLKYGKKWTG